MIPLTGKEVINGMEGQQAGECASKNSAQGAASYAHHDRIALNGSAAVLASSSALKGALGSPCEAEPSEEASAHPEKSAHDRNSLNASSADRALGSRLREHSEVVAASSASAYYRNARGSPCEAAGILEQSKNSEEVVLLSAHNNFLLEISAHDRSALNGAPGSPCKATAAGHNKSTDSRQHEAPPCEAILVSSSANNSSFPEKAALEASPCEAAGHNEAADGSQQQLAPPCGVAKLKNYTWHGMQIALPAALRLCKWCSLEDGVLEFRGSDATLREGMLLLDAAALHLQYNIVDGALWLNMLSSQYTDMLPGPVSQLLGLWEKRNGLVDRYTVSGSNGMIYNSILPKMLIADCYIFDTQLFAESKIADSILGCVVPRDLQAEVAFECVSATDDVKETWEKCECYISSNRAKMAIGICDRADQKEILIAYKDFCGDVTSEVQQDPSFIDLGRVMRGFRIYLSYMIPTVFMHFTVHHVYNLQTMPDENREQLLCSEITKGGNTLGMEIINGLGTVNFNDSMGRNPLVVAVSSGNVVMVHYLLECKANPRFLDGDGVCALLYAKAHDLQIFDALKSASDKDAIFSISDLVSALDKNSRKNFELTLTVVLASGVNIDEINEDHGYTILSRAVSDRRLLWAVSMLVQAGACPTKADGEGVIPLKHAILSLSEEKVLASGILTARHMDIQVVRSLVVGGMLDDRPRILEILSRLIRD